MPAPPPRQIAATFHRDRGAWGRVRRWGRLAVLGLLAALACDEDPVAPAGGAGQIVIQLVVAPAAGEPGGPAAMDVHLAPLAPTGALNHLDSARVTVTPATGSARTVTLTKGTGGFTGTVTDLATGTYSVAVFGYAAGDVDYYGFTTGVTVSANQTATASLTFATFIPSPAAIGSQTAQFRFAAQWPAVAGADSYKVELDRTSAFSNPSRTTSTGASATVTVTDTGTYYLRVRASNPRVPLGRPSGSQQFRVVRNAAETADNTVAGATSLGFGASGTTTFTGLNIFPAADVDWFTVAICSGDSLNVTARAGTLSPASPLSPSLQLYNPGDTLVSTGTVTGGDAVVALRSSREGAFRLRVASVGATIGHYDLVVVVAAGANQGPAGCKTSGTAVAQVVVTPAAPSITTVGGTANLSAQPKDAANANVTGKTATWLSLNPGIATVDASGLVTAVASGQTTIGAIVDGVAGFAPLQVNATGATPVSAWSPVTTGQSQQLNGVWGYSPNETYFAVGAGGTVLRYTASGWTVVTLGPQELRGLFGFSPTDLYLVGAAGTILHYDGSTFSTMSSGTTQDLNGVWGLSPTSIYAVGNAGTILHYNGIRWSPVTSPTTQNLQSVWGTAENAVWTVGAGGTIVRYDGTTWFLPTSTTTQNLYGVFGWGTTDVVAVGAAGTIVRFGGSGWAAQTSNTTQQLNAVWGSGATDIYAVGAQGTVVRYSGSGTTWNTQTSGTTQTLTGVWGYFGGGVYAVAANGSSLRGQRGSGTPTVSVSVSPAGSTLSGVGTTATISAQARDGSGTPLGGKTYTWRSLDPAVVTVSASGQLTAQAAGQAVVAVSADGVSGYGTVTVSTPGTVPLGASQPLSPGSTSNLLDAWGAGGQLFTAGADGRVRRYDGSLWTTWTVVPTGCCSVNGLWGLSATEVYAVWGATVSRFDGVAWTQMTTPGAAVPYNDVWASSPRDIHAVGDGGLASHYDGASWQHVPSGTTQRLNAVWGTSAIDAFAVGDNGTILHWTGSSWAPMTSGVAVNLYAVWGFSPTAIFAAGDNGTVLRYNGSTWSPVTTGFMNQILALWGASETDLYAAGDDGGPGRMWRYNGSTWQSVATGGSRFQGLWGSSTGAIHGVGEAGTIVRGVRGARTVTLTPGGATIATAGGSTSFAATATDLDGNPLSRTFTCATLNATVATAAPSGSNCMVTATGTGQVIVSATADAAVGYAVVTVAHPGGATPVSSWSAVTPVSSASLTGVWGTAGTNLYAVGAGGAIHRYNGTAWSTMSSGVTIDLAGIWGSSANDIYAYGGGNALPHFDGTSWSTVAPAGGPGNITAMWGDAPDHIWAAWNGTDIRLFDGGFTWLGTATFPNSVNAFWGSARDNVIAVGNNGLLRQWNGSSWVTMPTDGNWPNLNGVWGTAANDIWAVGNTGTIIHYNGSTWTLVSAPTATDLLGIYGISSAGNGMIVVGKGGQVLRWDSAAWRPMLAVTSADLRAIWGTSSSDMIAVGAAGTIRRGVRAVISAPAAPTNLVATPLTASQINLTWNDNASTEDGYTVEYCTGGSCTPTEFAALAPDAPSFQHTGLSVGTSYTYRVRAFNVGGYSSYSNSQTSMTAVSYNGSWGGTTSQSGKPITLQIASNAITSVTFDWEVLGCSVSGTTTTNFGSPINVSTGTFSRSGIVAGGLTYGLSGTFSSPSSVAGVLNLTWSSGCSASTSASWSAGPAPAAWTTLSPTGIPHDANGLPVLDAANNRLITFAGLPPSGAHTNTVSVLAGADGTQGTPVWSTVSANGAPGAPGARHAHGVAYDAQNNRLMIFGGCGGGCSPTLNDVWVLTNANGLGGTPAWTQLNPTGTWPAPRIAMGIAYDSVGNNLIVFGGQNGGGSAGATYAEVWVLSHANGLGGTPAWTQLTTSGTFPPGQYGPSAVYDAGNNRLVVFGGAAQGSGVATNAVYMLTNANGSGGTPTWFNVAVEGAANAPSPRTYQSAGYDPVGNRMIIFGGGPTDVRVLSNANTPGVGTWSALSPTGGPPIATAAGVYRQSTNRWIAVGSAGSTGAVSVLTGANGQ